MIKVFTRDCHERKNLIIILIITICLLALSCHKTQSHETLDKKMPAILVNMLSADDPDDYAEKHGIKLKDGMIRVIITVNKNLLLKDISGKYGLKDFKIREDLITTYISTNGLREICKEPGVIYIRLPVKFIP